MVKRTRCQDWRKAAAMTVSGTARNHTPKRAPAEATRSRSVNERTGQVPQGRPRTESLVELLLVGVALLLVRLRDAPPEPGKHGYVEQHDELGTGREIEE